MSDLENQTNIIDKIKKDPAPVVGIAGLLGVVGYSVFNFRKRDKSIKPSVYVIQTRVAAQGFVITALMVGLTYHMYNKYSQRNEPHENAFHRDLHQIKVSK